ncbi:hypothetical protein [Vibrio galatheae]|nr:hypothetical protein [Vibrio galatheae]
MSEYYYVSSAYPWLRLPTEVYDNALGLTYFEGISADFLHEFKNGHQVVFSPYVATPRKKGFTQYATPFEVELSRALGLSVEIVYEDNLLHLAYINLDATWRGPSSTQEFDNLNLFSLGISQYYHSLHIQAETMLSDNISSDWYLSVEYQLGRITPYTRYGQTRLTKDTESYLIGFRYDWTPSINTSVEWQRFLGRENVISGQFTQLQDPSKPFSTKVDLFSIGLSFTF